MKTARNFLRGSALLAVIVPFAALLCGSSPALAVAMVNLGNADPFAVLAGSTVTNVVSIGTVVTGNLGVSPGTAITGFPPGVVIGTQHSNDAVAGQAQTALTAAYVDAAGRFCPNNLTGQDLGGLTLTPGVYCYNNSAQLTGTLTLNAQGDPNAVFIFQIGSTLTTASASDVDIINSGTGDSVFWQVGSSATLGTTTDFAGNILALASITLNTNANITCGRALARNGAVTMDQNIVSIDLPGCEATGGVHGAPEPATLALFGAGLAGLGALRRRRKAKA